MFRKLAPIFVVLSLWTAPRALGSPAGDALSDRLAKRVTNYNLGVFSFIEALTHISTDFRIPMGIVWINAPAARAQMPFAWKDATVLQIIESITNTQRGYQVQVRNGVVHVFSPTSVPDNQNFLKLTIPEFQVHNEVEFASLKLRMLVAPIRGNHQISVGATGDSRVDIELRNSTVETILDALAVRSKRQIWIVTFSNDGGLTPRGFRRTVSLWNENSLPDDQQPVWDLLRWGNPLPPTISAAQQK